jgi:hypothetical protein
LSVSLLFADAFAGKLLEAALPETDLPETDLPETIGAR